MSEPAPTDVIVESEHPQSPKNLFVDFGLLVLEYFLAKWLLKQFGIWQKHNGPPVGRCQHKLGNPPQPNNFWAYNVNYDTYIGKMQAAQKAKKQTITMHFECQNENNPNYNELKLWYLTCVINANNGALNRMFIWPKTCPLEHHSWNVDDPASLGMLCGCGNSSTNPCSLAFQQCIDTGGKSVFWYFWNDVHLSVLPKLHAQTSSGCPSKCKTHCGTSSYCQT